jgi:hypothetical protein
MTRVLGEGKVLLVLLSSHKLLGNLGEPDWVALSFPRGSSGTIGILILPLPTLLRPLTVLYSLNLLPIFLAYWHVEKRKNQVRRKFGEISYLVKIPKLEGISAIGRQLSYHEFNKASGSITHALPDSFAIVADTASNER